MEKDCGKTDETYHQQVGALVLIIPWKAVVPCNCPSAAGSDDEPQIRSACAVQGIE